MSTRDEKETEKFGKNAPNWWDENSPYHGLLRMNEIRVPFIQSGLLTSLQRKESETAKPLENLRILDVGCGGGFLSEALARLGATVTGIDASEECIQVATTHAVLDEDLKGNLTYIYTTAEDLVGTIDPFDAIVCSEVIEHVNNPPLLVESCAKLVKENGSLFFTTINKTITSYLEEIVMAEYVFGFIPKGTHEWRKFITPNDLKNMLQTNGCKTQLIRGFAFNVITHKWSYTSWTSSTYGLHAIKEKCD